MKDAILNIKISQIKTGRNPRRRFDPASIEELASTISEHGLIQPIVLEPAGDGYILIAGERRLRAHVLLKRKTIKSIIREQTNHNGRERYLAAIVENVQREDMNPIDEAQAFLDLKEEYGMTTREISNKTGQSLHKVDNAILLTKLDAPIQKFIEDGWWKDPRLVRGLLEIEDPKDRIALAERLFKHRVSLNGCLAAVGRAKMEIAKAAGKKHKRIAGTPAFGFGHPPAKPLRWDAMKQAGQVPEWELVVHSVEQTCQACPLRDIANEINCRDCPTVYLVRTLIKGAK